MQTFNDFRTDCGPHLFQFTSSSGRRELGFSIGRECRSERAIITTLDTIWTEGISEIGQILMPIRNVIKDEIHANI